MILHTSAHCITDPPCEWVGTTDKSAEKHVRETGHATVTVTIPVTTRGRIEISEAAPDLTPEPPLTLRVDRSITVDSSAELAAAVAEIDRLVAEVRTGMRGYSEGDLRAVAQYLANAVMALRGMRDPTVWPRVKRAIYATTVSRAAIDFEWPECHRKNCQGRHGSPDEAFHIFAKRVADTVYSELVSRCISDPDAGDDDEGEATP